MALSPPPCSGLRSALATYQAPLLPKGSVQGLIPSCLGKGVPSAQASGSERTETLKSQLRPLDPAGFRSPSNFLPLPKRITSPAVRSVGGYKRPSSSSSPDAPFPQAGLTVTPPVTYLQCAIWQGRKQSLLPCRDMGKGGGLLIGNTQNCAGLPQIFSLASLTNKSTRCSDGQL